MKGIRYVDRRNFPYESLIFIYVARQCNNNNPLVFLDTEFPGVIHRPAKYYTLLSLDDRYATFKRNVDDLHLIQTGITLCNPVTKHTVTWQFDISDFDVRRHAYAPESIALLQASGVDVERTRRMGVPSWWFVRMLFDAELVGPRSVATWVTFQGAYDFGLLLKAFAFLRERRGTGKELPEKLPATLGRFMEVIRCYFGSCIYDVRCLMKRCNGLHGGLELLAAQLNMKREVGRAHNAGSDSMLTCGVFLKIKMVFFENQEDGKEEKLLPFAGVLFGLEE